MAGLCFDGLAYWTTKVQLTLTSPRKWPGHGLFPSNPALYSKRVYLRFYPLTVFGSRNNVNRNGIKQPNLDNLPPCMRPLLGMRFFEAFGLVTSESLA